MEPFFFLQRNYLFIYRFHTRFNRFTQSTNQGIFHIDWCITLVIWLYLDENVHFLIKTTLLISTIVFTQSIIISGAATASFLVATVIMCSNYMANDVSRRILAASLIALLNALIYGADCFFTCKYVTEWKSVKFLQRCDSVPFKYAERNAIVNSLSR